jgi:type IV pilus assembly protein PilE
VVKANRTDAMAGLQTMAQAMERYYARNNYSYLNADTAGILPGTLPLDGAARYTLSVGEPTATEFTLTATPIEGTSQDEDGFLQITNTGARGWDKNNNGRLDAGENSWSDR